MTLDELIDGFDRIETLDDLSARVATKKPLRIKLGLDPTSADLHLGHTVILSRLQRFIEAGHQAVLVIGDFTARIGDPSGRNDTRPALSDEQIAANMATYKEQAGRVLDLERVEVRYNREWLDKLGLSELLRLLSHVTVAQMLKREDFANRHASGIPISLHEFLYPIAQAYDSVELRADIELGGNDQLFNVLMGRHFQGVFGQAPQVCMTTPILEGLDGVKKMSKSLGNAIGLSETPENQFGKTMRIPDEMIPRWSQLLLGMPTAQATELGHALTAGTAHPMDEKKRLAAAIVARYHGAVEAARARDHFERTVQRHEAPTELVRLRIASGTRICDALVQAGFAESKRAAMRLITGGGVRLDGVHIKEQTTIVAGPKAVLAVGSRHFIELVIDPALGGGSDPAPQPQ